MQVYTKLDYVNTNRTVEDRSTSKFLPTAAERPTVPLWPMTGRAFGLGRSATYAAAARGEIPVLRVGGRLIVPTAAVRRMLQLDVDQSDPDAA